MNRTETENKQRTIVLENVRNALLYIYREYCYSIEAEMKKKE